MVWSIRRRNFRIPLSPPYFQQLAELRNQLAIRCRDHWPWNLRGTRLMRGVSSILTISREPAAVSASTVSRLRWQTQPVNPARSTTLNHFRDSLKGPVNFLAADDERWCDANHPVMRFLAQDPFFLERFAVRTRWAVDFDADPQAFAANVFQI